MPVIRHQTVGQEPNRGFLQGSREQVFEGEILAEITEQQLTFDGAIDDVEYVTGAAGHGSPWH